MTKHLKTLYYSLLSASHRWFLAIPPPYMSLSLVCRQIHVERLVGPLQVEAQLSGLLLLDAVTRAHRAELFSHRFIFTRPSKLLGKPFTFCRQLMMSEASGCSSSTARRSSFRASMAVMKACVVCATITPWF